MSESILDRVPVIPVVVIDDVAHAVPLARALADGGLPVIEVTLRTPVALRAIHTIREQVPEVLVGAGTILSPANAIDAAREGAQFLVSPGSTPRLLDSMLGTGLPFLPGTSTVSEVLAVLEQGLTELKFFPAESSGGASYLRAISAVAPQARFCPTGGITPESAPSYLRLANVPCVGGSWIAPLNDLHAGNWEHISKRAADAARFAI